jgi:hypothetical protein
MLHHDNAPAHTAVRNQTFLAANKIPVIPTHRTPLILHPDFLFPEMKLRLKGRRFDTIEDIQAETQRA